MAMSLARRWLIVSLVMLALMAGVYAFFALNFSPKPVTSNEAKQETKQGAKQDDKAEGNKHTSANFQSLFSLQSRRCDYDPWVAPSAQCFTASHAEHAGIHFPITVLKAQLKNVPSTKQKPTDAVVIIPGGPGQGGQTSAEWIAYWAQWQQDYGINYDLILYEPRGTDGSSLYWQCPAYNALALSLAAQNITVLEEESALTSTVDQCMAEYHRFLQSRGMAQGLLGLNSVTNAADLRAMMALLRTEMGYRRYHLWGTSYGTRVALLAAEDALVASLTLDSPYPFDKGAFSEWPILFENSVNIHERLFGLLMPSEPSYKLALEAAMAYLTEHPQIFELSRWDGEADVRFTLNAERLLSLQFDVLYGVDMLAPFYRGLVDIQSKPDELTWALENYVTNVFEPSFSTMVYIATECNDNGSESRQVFSNAIAELTFKPLDWLSLHAQDVCARPIFTQASPESRITWKSQPYSQRPTLIFSGRNDPVTPVAWAQHLKAGLSDARLMVVDGSGHGLLTENTCDWSAIQQFWASGDVSKPIECNVLAPDQ